MTNNENRGEDSESYELVWPLLAFALLPLIPGELESPVHFQ